MTNRLMKIMIIFSGLISSTKSFSDEKFIQFPTHFKWGAATAAYQIEGGNTDSDLADWEKIPGKFKNNEKSGDACDHWNRTHQDIQLMKDLNIQYYRFSVEWSKIEPTEGNWNQKAIEHYQQEVADLLASGIEPIITLHHFTLPRWVRSHGGWEWDGAPAAFEKFTRLVVSKIAPTVQYWVTINEPMNYLAGGYIAGVLPPGKTTGVPSVIPPLKGILKSHLLSYRMIKQTAKEQNSPREPKVGMAFQMRVFEPRCSINLIEKSLAKCLTQVFNWSVAESLETGYLKIKIPFIINENSYIDGLAGTQDYLGINYYTRDILKLKLTDPNKVTLSPSQNGEHSDMGWEIYPEGFYEILKSTRDHIPNKPILITENGIADASDQFRPKFLKDHLRQIHRAIQEGIPIEGYIHWSLMDNFEWTDGFFPRFGLYQVDYKTQERKARPSALFYANTIKDNGFWVTEK